MRYVLFLIAAWVIFTVFVTVFALAADAKRVRVLPKIIWVAICLLVPFIGGILYLTVGRPITPPDSEGKRTKFRAPDDDPDFLRNLSRKLKDDSADQ